MRLFLVPNVFYKAEFMGMCLLLGIVNAGLIYTINSYVPVGMNYMMVFQQHTNVYDISLLVVKKGQIPRCTFFNKAQGSALCSLFRCIAVATFTPLSVL